jgi:uncharacterized protein (TIGR01777 family)
VAGRDIHKVQQIFGSVGAKSWNASQPVDPQIFSDIDTVYHLAGESVFHGRWNNAKKERIRASRVDGTRHLVDGIAKAEKKPTTLICSSAVGFYGDRGDTPLTERSTGGDDFLAAVCRDWEAEALRAEELGIRVVLVRTGIVLGRGGGALKQMLPPFKLGLGGRIGSGRQYMPWIHIDDLIGIMLYARENTSLRGPVNAVAPNPVTNRVFTKSLAGALHRPALFPVPGFALKTALGEFGEVLLGSQRVIPETLTSSGFTFDFPEIDSALQDLLA